MGKQFRINLSQLQASSCQSVCQNLEDSIDGINDAVSGAASLGSMKGMGATHVRAYATEVVVPMLRAAVMLTQGVDRDVQQLPKRYVAQVDSKSHDEDELEQEIQDIQNEIQMTDNIINMVGKIDKGIANKLKNSTKGVRSDEEARLRKLKRILRDFRRYDRESGGLFSDLDALREAFDTATREIKSCTIQSGSEVGFKMPQDMSWAHYVNKKWKQMEERQKNFLRDENRKIKENIDDASSKLNDGVSLVDGLTHDVGKGLSANLNKLGDGMQGASEALDDVNAGLGIFMSVAQMHEDMKHGKSFGVAAMKDCGGVALGLLVSTVVPGGLLGAAAGVVAVEGYSAMYDHVKFFRHAVNGAGHLIDHGISDVDHGIHDVGHGLKALGHDIKTAPHDFKRGMKKGEKILSHVHISGLPKGSIPGPNGYSSSPSF